MWIWLAKEDHVIDLKGTNGKRFQLIDMQAYADGSRGLVGSLLLFWEHPGLQIALRNPWGRGDTNRLGCSYGSGQ